MLDPSLRRRDSWVGYYCRGRIIESDKKHDGLAVLVPSLRRRDNWVGYYCRGRIIESDKKHDGLAVLVPSLRRRVSWLLLQHVSRPASDSFKECRVSKRPRLESSHYMYDTYHLFSQSRQVSKSFGCLATLVAWDVYGPVDCRGDALCEGRHKKYSTLYWVGV